MTQPTTSGTGAGYDAPPAVEPKKPEKASLVDDFMDIFYAPSKVFARRANASFWIPLLILSVLAGVIFLANRDLFEPIMDAEMTRAMAKAGQNMNADQLAAARKVSGVFASIGAFVGAPIAMLFLGVIIWIVGKFFDAKESMNAAISVAVFSYVPRVVEGIIARVQGLFVDPSSLNSRFSLSLGVGRFLDPDTTSPMLLAIVGRIDLFTIWVTVLVAIGLAVTGKISRGRATIAAVIIWLVGALPSIAGALRQ